MIGDPSGHSGRSAKRLVHAPEVIPAVPEHHGSAVVLPLFTETVRQPSESPEAHAERKIRAFDYRSADAVGVGSTHDWDYLYGGYFSGAVAAFAFGACFVDLDELREVAAVVQRVADR